MKGAAEAPLPLSAAVLAGGMSRRMGTDKALLPLVEGGEPMLALVLERLCAVADDVVIVAHDAARYERFGIRIVPDVHAEIGALGGIHAALSYAMYDHCLVVACDMPFLNAGLLEYMATAPRDFDVLVPALPGESRQRRTGEVLQTLHAIYSKRCLAPIEVNIRDGRRQIVGFFEDVAVRRVTMGEIGRWDPELHSFMNVNTPEALAAANVLVDGGEPNTEWPRSSG